MSSEYLVPYWLSDPDYYGKNDPRRAEHIRKINLNKRMDGKIAACVADGSYSVLITRGERC